MTPARTAKSLTNSRRWDYELQAATLSTSEQERAALKLRRKRDLQNAAHKRYRDNIKVMLYQDLGVVCKKCGSDHALEFDIIVPVGDPKAHHGKMSSTARLSFYRRQHLGVQECSSALLEV